MSEGDAFNIVCSLGTKICIDTFTDLKRSVVPQLTTAGGFALMSRSHSSFIVSS